MARAALALSCTLAGACGREASPEWTQLWRADVEPAALALEDEAWARAAAVRLRPEAEKGGVWLDLVLPAALWTPWDHADFWTVPRPAQRGTLLAQGEELVLSGGSRPLRPDPLIRGTANLAVDSYFTRRGRVVLRVPPGEKPPDGLVLSLFLPRSRRAPDGWHAEAGGFTGNGFSVWTGEVQRVPVSFGEERALRFCSVAQDAFERPAGSAGKVTFRVELDGDVLFEEAQEAGALANGRWRSIALPSEGRSKGELAFSVSGDAAVCAILAPVIGPARVEERLAPRPSVVLFLADTFRADNLAAYGGAPELAPSLNALAAESLRFVRAWSPSTWTMPSQSSMLTGLYPEQHAAVEWEAGLADSLTTIAEHLGQHGYRTGAITDSYCVSRDFGFDQGFEWFQERREWSLQETLAAARAFLSADDGRPTFLFVQTYRAHMPYRSDDADVSKDVLALRAELDRRWKEEGGERPRELPDERMRELYQRGVKDLDRQVGLFLADLESAGFFERGFLVFTSDHGEAFGEHGKSKHTGRPFEEESRIPLLVHGRGLEPADVRTPASLVDLPRTIAALAGVPPAGDWGGGDLLRAEAERTVYSFVRLRGASNVAFVERDRKIHALADPELLRRGEHLGAFDLARDPGELRSLDEGWVSELCRAQAGPMIELVTPRVTARRIELSEEDRAHLRAIGYGE